MTDNWRGRPDEREDEDDGESPLEQVVAGVVIASIFLVGFGLLALGQPWFWVAFPVGFAGVLPAAIGLVRWYESRSERENAAGDGVDDDERADALAALRDRYARGDVDEAEFERRLEALLETEDVDTAREYAARSKAARAEGDGEAEPEADVEAERDRA